MRWRILCALLVVLATGWLLAGVAGSTFARAGAPAYPAALAGADLKDIMAQTRHRSHDIALRYIRRAEIWKNNVTKLLFSPRGINEAQS